MKTRDEQFFGRELQLLIFIEKVQCYLQNKKSIICIELISDQTSCRVHEMADTLCFHSEGNIHKDAPQLVKLHPITTTEIQFCAMIPHLGETSPYCL